MSIAQSSRAALGEISMSDRKSQGDVIFDLVQAACRNGAHDMSLREIAYTYELQNGGRRIDVGTVSARVNALITAKRLVRLKDQPRPCTRSGVSIEPVTVPARQERMF